MTFAKRRVWFTNLSTVLRAYDEGRLFAEAYGDAALRVLWLHGWRRSAADFAPAARLLASAGVSSLALDLPGFGASPLPEVRGGAQVYADALMNVVKDLAHEPLVIVGHSFGGRVALTLAAREPDLFRHLILTGTPLLRATNAVASPRGYRLVRWARSMGLISEARLERARQRYGSDDYRHAQGPLREILIASVNESYESQLRALRTPLTLLWGERDTVTPVSVAERASALVSAPWSLRRLDGVGHLAPLEAPEAFRDAVLEVVAS